MKTGPRSWKQVMLSWGVLVGVSASAWGAPFSSTQSGLWANASTWGGGDYPKNPADTAVINSGHIVTNNTDTPTITSVTVGSSGVFLLYGAGAPDVRTITQALIMADGAVLRGQRPYGYMPTDVHQLYGSMSVTGITRIGVDYAHLGLRGTIFGTGGLLVEGLLPDGNQRSVFLYGNNTFSGNVTLTNNSSVYLYHANAFGSTADKVVRMCASSGAGRLFLTSTAGRFGTNRMEVVLQSLNTFYQGRATLVDCLFTMKGGIYAIKDGEWAVPGPTRTNSGEIALAPGYISTITHGGDSGGAPMGIWRQHGTITGEGSLYITGENGYDASLWFAGSNTYSGGTFIRADGDILENRVYSASDTAFGIGPVEINGSATYSNAFILATNCTMPNAFRGRGNIRTDAYVLTTVGSIAPNDSGYGSVPTQQIGTFNIEDLKFGSDTQGCTYYWQYNGTTNDLLICASLQFGAAQNTLRADWLGTGPAPVGEYVIMSYGGVAPAAGNWRVVNSAGHKGRVWVDSANSRVMARFWRAGTVVFIR